MAQRDLTNLRTVDNVVAEKPMAVLEASADMGMKVVANERNELEEKRKADALETQRQANMFADIRRQNNEAAIVEKMSMATLELNALDDQYRMDFEKNPLAGTKEYDANRKKVFENLGKDIDPSYKMEWDRKARLAMLQNDAARQSWALKQTQVNTVASINNTIKTDLQQAYADGAKFGSGDETDIRPYLNFGNSLANIVSFGNKNLGENKTNELAEGYGDSYMKQVLSGVAETNPIKALQMMDDETVKSLFKDPEQFTKMKDAVEARALKVEELNGQREVLGILKGNAALFDRSKNEQIGYAELMDLAQRNGASETATSVLLKINGYKKEEPKEAKIEAGEKASLKQSLYSRVMAFSKDEGVTSEDLSGLQNDLFTAVDKGALTMNEATMWFGQILTPFVDEKEKSLSTFSDNAYFSDDLGLDGLREAFDASAIQPADGEQLGVLAQTENTLNRNRLYDGYMGYLAIEAERRGIPVAKIPELNRDIKRSIYATAQRKALEDFNARNYPSLAMQKDTPNVVIPVFRKPSDLQDVYAKGRNGTADITRDQIMEAARNKNMSPDAVINALRNKGVIE